MKNLGKIAGLEGDETGPEIMQEARKVLNATAQKYGFSFDYVSLPYGGSAVYSHQHPYPEVTRRFVKEEAACVLKGPIGLSLAKSTKLEQEKGFVLERDALLPLRGDLDTYACYRPARLVKSCVHFSSTKPELVHEGIDFLVLREITGGNYFGVKSEALKKGILVQDYAIDEGKYTVAETERFAEVCFKEAQARNWRVVNVHKKNILAESRLWNYVFSQVAKKYPNVNLEEILVDNASCQIQRDPAQFNYCVMATDNLFGDILTDQIAGVIGSLGLMPSACFNPETGRGYYEPSHGSAPDIARQNKANPYAMIGCVAYMLEKSFGFKEAANDIWKGLELVFSNGFMTGELFKLLSDSQREYRVQRHVDEFFSVYEIVAPGVTRDRLKLLVGEHFNLHDSLSKARIVSTTQFGDMVVGNILNRGAA